MCWWANMRVRRETWPSTCLQLNRLQIKCSILRCCACTWRMTSERGSQWLGLLFARMQMRLQVRRTWRGAQIHQFTFQWQILRRKTRKQWDWHATNQSRIPRCSSWTPTPITTSEKIFGVLCIRRRQNTSICSLWHPHTAVWKTTVLCLELLSTSHRPAECCRGWCLISILWNSYWYGQACCDGMCNVRHRACCRSRPVPIRQSHIRTKPCFTTSWIIDFQAASAFAQQNRAEHCLRWVSCVIQRSLWASLNRVCHTKDSQLVRTSSGVTISVFVALGKSLYVIVDQNDVEAQGVAMMDTGRSLVR